MVTGGGHELDCEFEEHLKESLEGDGGKSPVTKFEGRESNDEVRGGLNEETARITEGQREKRR